MMLNDDGKAPSRFELLNMVKKHSALLGQTTVSEQDVSDVEKDHSFWHDVMELYFVLGTEARKRLDDDLIFFVRKMRMDGFELIDSAEDSPYFVRRWAPTLDNLVEKNAINVDWRCSFYLNLIAHTSFSVTVLICSNQALHNHQNGETTSISPVYKVVKTVYASPDRVNFHLDSRKEVETTPAYPDICFAVDDFDSTFDAMVLTDADHCFCVLLNAHGGAAFPSEMISQDSSSSNNSALHSTTDAGKIKHAKVTLFSGFVSYQVVRDASDAGKSGFGGLLSLGHSSGKAHKLDMKGPGGRGEVEVAVSGLSASMNQSSDKILPLKCCLMSISLPWECIAYDLLYKGISSVK